MKVPLSENAKLLLDDPDASRDLMVAMIFRNKEHSGEPAAPSLLPYIQMTSTLLL